jgi:hypothetical protein
MNMFEQLSAVNVNEYTEKKGKFTYLSWAFAVQELLKRCPDATWEMPEPTAYPDGTMMVWCKMTADGITRTAYLPVLDHNNKPIENPSAFQVNTAMQRCLAKAIGLMGLGLYIYAGEDLPEVTDYSIAKQFVTDGAFMALKDWLIEIGEDRQIALYNDAPSGEKVSWKKLFNEQVKKADEAFQDYASQVASLISNGDPYGLAQIFDEMNTASNTLKRRVWAVLTSEQQQKAKELSEVTG